MVAAILHLDDGAGAALDRVDHVAGGLGDAHDVVHADLLLGGALRGNQTSLCLQGAVSLRAAHTPERLPRTSQRNFGEFRVRTDERSVTAQDGAAPAVGLRARAVPVPRDASPQRLALPEALAHEPVELLVLSWCHGVEPVPLGPPAAAAEQVLVEQRPGRGVVQDVDEYVEATAQGFVGSWAR